MGVPERNGALEVLDIFSEFLGLANRYSERHGVAGGLSHKRCGGYHGQGSLLAVRELKIFNSPDICGHFRTFCPGLGFGG